MTLTRNLPLIAEQSALLIIDVQNFSTKRDGGEFGHMSDEEFEAKAGPFMRRIWSETIPNIRRLQGHFRAAGAEVIFTNIESLTRDGRDRSLDYKITGFNVPKGSHDAQTVDEIAPVDDEIVIPKTSSSVFISTNIDYVLRNLGIRQVTIVGLVTDQCVESAIRDACDMGYLVTQVTDACMTYTEERQSASINAIKGYCRQLSTDELISELSA